MRITCVTLWLTIAIPSAAQSAQAEVDIRKELESLRNASARGDVGALVTQSERLTASAEPGLRDAGLLAAAIASFRRDDVLRCARLTDSLLQRERVDPRTRSIGLRFRAMASMHYGAFDDALIEARAAGAAVDSVASAIDAADALVILAEAHIKGNDFQSALEAIDRAERVAREVGYERAQGAVAVVTGSMRFRQRRYDEAEAQFRSALAVAARGGYDVLAANAAANLGAITNMTGRYAEAIQLYDSLLLSLGNEKPRLRAIILTNKGMAHASLRDAKRATRCYQRALAIADSMGDGPEKLDPLRMLANDDWEAGRRPQAMAAMREALDLAKRFAAQDAAAAILYQLCAWSAASGDGDRAESYLDEYVTLTDSINEARFNERIAYAEVRYDTERKERMIEQQRQALLLAEAEDRRKALQRNLSLALSGLFLLALGLVWRSLRERKRLAAKEHELHLKQVDKILLEQEAGRATALIESLDRERLRVAKDLHDRMGGMMSTIKLRLEALESHHPGLDGSERFREVLRQIDEVASEVRGISHDMREGKLDSGLLRALQELRDAVEASGRLRMVLSATGLEGQLPRPVEVAAYRIVQQLVANALKHARAKRIDVAVERGIDSLTIAVSDDGIGFDLEAASKGLGLDNVAERAASVRGRASFESAKGKGTRVEVMLPVPERA